MPTRSRVSVDLSCTESPTALRTRSLSRQCRSAPKSYEDQSDSDADDCLIRSPSVARRARSALGKTRPIRQTRHSSKLERSLGKSVIEDDEESEESDESSDEELRTPSRRSKRSRLSHSAKSSASQVKKKLKFDSKSNSNSSDNEAEQNDENTKPVGENGTGNAETSAKIRALDIIRAAAALFRTSTDTVDIIGREEQYEKIEKFLRSHLEEGKAGSLYVYGAPGTGKSFLLENILSSIPKKSNIVKCNCMTTGAQPRSIYPRIAQSLTGQLFTIQDSLKQIEKFFLESKSKNLTILFLDEIDQLINKDQEVLYQIFEWPKLPGSKCILVGIANAIDLTDRILPRLKAKQCEPEFVAFPTYTDVEISKIIRGRLDSLTDKYPEWFKDGPASTTLFQNAAIELCAKKVAAFGDFRKALDVCRNSFELLESGLSKDINQDNNDFILPKVTVKHVLSILDTFFGAANPSVQKIKNLTPHQKILVALISLLDSNRSKLHHQIDFSLMKIYEIFVTVARRTFSVEVTRSEFQDIVNGIDQVGLIGKSVCTPSKSRNQNNLKQGPSTPSTPKQSLAPRSQLTPVSGRKPSTPKHGKSTGISLTDSSYWIVLNANEQEVALGVADMPMIAQFLSDGLPDYATSTYFHDRSNMP